MKQPEINFLTLAELIEIHGNQVSLYGGETGIRDITLLSSAMAIPRSTFDGKYLQNDIFEMAAAYIFHIAQNHPFLDGNKRTALAAGLVFLDFNGITIDDPSDRLYAMMMRVASGKGDKKYITEVLRGLSPHSAEK
ncbi:MAG: type II toxin-antitoxin system death-on-curing family toxin [Spirochaetae bacterium HGW-Spirochaetae-1]|jgi:death-on-curing protein|nr:MAG: type II toxin-antitoxin system death-on-curing family toxin [Spirochaetae bacterium HGW-Spirochaetae-1]